VRACLTVDSDSSASQVASCAKQTAPRREDAVVAASLVELRHSPMKSCTGSVASMESLSQSRSPSQPRTPVLSPHVNRFLMAELTNAPHKPDAENSPSHDAHEAEAGGTPAVPAFSDSPSAAGMSPMELGRSTHGRSTEGEAGCQGGEAGRNRNSLLKQVHRNKKRARGNEEGNERRRVSARRATVDI